MANYGLIGKNIDYSFSRSFFKKKFEKENLDHIYQNFDIESIKNFRNIIENTSNLKGLNVTIPYKEEVIPYLDKLNKKAKAIGAVNTIKITENGKLHGYNTDYFGFKKSLESYLQPHHQKALILGTGGASKAVSYALEKLSIEFRFVSRNPKSENDFSYKELTSNITKEHQIIVNCTPIGTFPNTDICPSLPYNAIGENHLLYDLIYNPAETKFLTLGKQNGAQIINGERMLILQAQKSWKIWHKP